MGIKVKICGIKTKEALGAAVESGADYLGFVFCEASPRAVALREAAAFFPLVPESICKVGLFVSPDDQLLRKVLGAVSLDMIQLHGPESPKRVRDIKAQTGLPVMKAISIATLQDLNTERHYQDVADMLLFDAKPPPCDDNGQAFLPGGNALSFDWRLLQGYRGKLPWMLAGGLTADNLTEAVTVSKAQAVDVSSGVERAKGLKEPDLIRDFLQAAHTL